MVGLVALPLVISITLSGFKDHGFFSGWNDTDTNVDEAVIIRAPCDIEIIGDAEQYDRYTAPDFTIFLKDIETGKWKVYATYICYKKDQYTELIKGEYLLYSKYFGECEFSVDDLSRKYTIIADLNNKSINFR